MIDYADIVFGVRNWKINDNFSINQITFSNNGIFSVVRNARYRGSFCLLTISRGGFGMGFFGALEFFILGEI